MEIDKNLLSPRVGYSQTWFMILNFWLGMAPWKNSFVSLFYVVTFSHEIEIEMGMERAHQLHILSEEKKWKSPWTKFIFDVLCLTKIKAWIEIGTV